MITPGGTKEWYLHGICHRADGPAVVHLDGSEEWLVDGKRHRVDGPALSSVNGLQEWWVDGKLHRIDGPAVTHSNGLEEWWVRGKRCTKPVAKFMKEHNVKSVQEMDEEIQCLFWIFLGTLT